MTSLSTRSRTEAAGLCAGPGPRAGGVNTSPMATTLLNIGQFSRMTHLSVKALRHYHDVGILEPARSEEHTSELQSPC